MKLDIFGRLALASLLAVTAPALACDVCAIYTAANQRTEHNGFLLGVGEQYTHFGTLSESGSEVPNTAHQYLDSAVTQLFAGYNFTSRFGVQVTLPVISRTFRRPENGRNESGRLGGIGDLSLTGHFVPFDFATERSVFRLTLLGGVKFPTGDPDRIKEELSESPSTGGVQSGIHGHDLALGSGSYDGLVGGSLFWSRDRFFVTAAGQYSIRSRGAFDYRYANDLSWLGGPGYYVLLEHGYSLALQVVLSGESKGKDDLAGVPADDTGVTALYVGPACSVTWGGRLSADIGVDVPVLQHNTSLQLLPDVRVRGGITWSF